MTIIKTFDTQVENQLVNFKSKKFLLGVLCLSILAIAEIWVNNNMAHFGGQYESIFKLQKNLTLENQLLENEIAKHASLQKIASESATLGFTRPKTIQYLR